MFLAIRVCCDWLGSSIGGLSRRGLLNDGVHVFDLVSLGYLESMGIVWFGV